MKKRIIFTTITLGLVTLLGFGFLGEQPKEVKASEVMIPSKKYIKLTNSTYESMIGSDHIYYAVAKNYAENGADVFYQGSITLDNSAIEGDYQLRLFLDCTLINENQTEFGSFNFFTDLSGGVYHLSRVSLYNETLGTQFIYNAQDGVFNRNYCAFVFTNLRYRTEGSIGHLDMFYRYFDIYDLNIYEESYDFENAFNFNNFYQVNNTFYAQPFNAVVGATTGNTDWIKTYNTGIFYSGGLAFDTIRVTFARNNGYFFETSPHSKDYKQYNLEIAGASNYYFLQMEYLNSATNFSLTACNRTSFQQGSTSYIEFLPAWAGQSYKVIQFQDTIRNLFTKSVFNSLSDTTQLNEPVYQPDIGLGNAFSLIGLAFTAWLPILQVSVIPGITLGMLIFLPLIAGIIIFIIWIVKR